MLTLILKGSVILAYMYFLLLVFLFSYDSWSSIGKEKVPTYKIYLCIAYRLWGSFIHVQGGEICQNVILRQNLFRKLGNFNFQWTKTLYQNNFNNTAFSFALFRGYKFDKLYEITP